MIMLQCVVHWSSIQMHKKKKTGEKASTTYFPLEVNYGSPTTVSYEIKCTKIFKDQR